MRPPAFHLSCACLDRLTTGGKKVGLRLLLTLEKGIERNLIAVRDRAQVMGKGGDGPRVSPQRPEKETRTLLVHREDAAFLTGKREGKKSVDGVSFCGIERRVNMAISLPSTSTNKNRSHAGTRERRGLPSSLCRSAEKKKKATTGAVEDARRHREDEGIRGEQKEKGKGARPPLPLNPRVPGVGKKEGEGEDRCGLLSSGGSGN